MSRVDDDYRWLLVYGGVGGAAGSAEDDPACAEWLAALRARANADGLRLEVGFHFDVATREYPVVRVARCDGESFGFEREIPDWPFPVEREWGETLEAARQRMRVGRFAPPPPEHLRPDLVTLYEDGILLPYGDKASWLRRWEELIEVSGPTGCRVLGRVLTDALWDEEFARTRRTKSVDSFSFLSVADPRGARYDMGTAGLDRRDLAPARAYMRRVLERDYGRERLDWLREWARGEAR